MIATTTTPAALPRIALLRHFAGLDDPRQSAKIMFPLPEIMLLVLAATIASSDDLVEVRDWGATGALNTSISCANICRTRTISRATTHWRTC